MAKRTIGEFERMYLRIFRRKYSKKENIFRFFLLVFAFLLLMGNNAFGWFFIGINFSWMIKHLADFVKRIFKKQ